MSLGKPASSDALGVGSLNIDDTEAAGNFFFFFFFFFFCDNIYIFFFLLGGYLGIFQKPVVDTLLHKSQTIELLPVHTCQPDQPLDFTIAGYHDKFLDMSSIRLCGQVTLKKVAADGTLSDPAKASDDVSTTSIFPLAMFKSLSVTINNTEVMDISSYCYPFKVLVDCLCSYEESAKKSVLSTMFYTPEEVDKEDVTTKAAAEKDFTEYDRRRLVVIDGKPVQFLTSVFAEFFHTQRLLLPGMVVKLRWLPGNSNFPLIGAKATCANKYRLIMTNPKLMFKLVTVDPAVTTSLVSRLEKNQLALYPYCRTSVTHHTVIANTTTQTFPALFTGPLPTQILACFLDNDCFEGVMEKNPFVFPHHDVINFTFYKNGDPVHSYRPKFDQKEFLEVYQAFLDCLSIHRGNYGIGITKESFMSNSCFYAYDDLPDSCNNAHMHLHSASSTGIITASVTFKSAITKPLKLLLFAGHYKTLTVDKDLNTALVNTI